MGVLLGAFSTCASTREAPGAGLALAANTEWRQGSEAVHPEQATCSCLDAWPRLQSTVLGWLGRGSPEGTRAVLGAGPRDPWGPPEA